MKKLSIFIINLFFFACLFSFVGCSISEKDVVGIYNFVGGWFGADDETGERTYISLIIDGEETFPNVTAIPEGINGFMNKASFYVEITDENIIEHGNIQFSGAKFLVNHSLIKEYSYNLTRQKNNKNAFDIYDENGNATYFEVWENSLIYRYNYSDGNILCLSFIRNN